MNRAMLNSSARRVFGFLILGLSICLMTATGNAQYQGTKKESPSPSPMQKAESGKMTVPDGQVKTPSPRPQEKGPQTELHLYLARYAKAQELATILSQVFQDPNSGQPALLQVTVDGRANRLILSTSPAIWNEVNALLQKLDTVSGEDNGGMRLVTFSLQGLGDDYPLLQNALAMILDKNTSAKYTLDGRGHSLLIYGDERTIAEVNQLCNLLREAAAAAKKGAVKGAAQEPVFQPLQVRLLWLANSPKGTDGEPLPNDVLKVNPVLEKLGIRNPRVVGNYLVSTVSDQTFKCSGSSSFGPIDFSGTCHLSGDIAQLSVSLRVGGEKPHPNLPSANIETTVLAPLNHLLLLGMTPTSDRTFVFVLQVTQPDFRAIGALKE